MKPSSCYERQNLRSPARAMVCNVVPPQHLQRRHLGTYTEYKIRFIFLSSFSQINPFNISYKKIKNMNSKNESKFFLFLNTGTHFFLIHSHMFPCSLCVWRSLPSPAKLGPTELTVTLPSITNNWFKNGQMTQLGPMGYEKRFSGKLRHHNSFIFWKSFNNLCLFCFIVMNSSEVWD